MFESLNKYSNDSVEDNTPELSIKASDGANWFYWIAGLSIINSVINLFGGEWNFAIGLGVTQVFDALSKLAAEDGADISLRVAIFILSAVIAGLFFFFGVFANRRQMWAFITGIVVYALDGLLMLVVFDVLGIIIHAIALYFLIRGANALRILLRTSPAMLINENQNL